MFTFTDLTYICFFPAWTDTDHTCYTMTTAGSEGVIYFYYLSMLGVFSYFFSYF